MSIACPDCAAPAGAPEWKGHTHIMWANQHGQKIRVFCAVCGAWNDIREVGNVRTVRQVHAPTSPSPARPDEVQK